MPRPYMAVQKEVKQAWWAPKLTLEPPGASMVALIAMPHPCREPEQAWWASETGQGPCLTSTSGLGNLARWAPEVDASEPSGATCDHVHGASNNCPNHRTGKDMLTPVLVLAWCYSPPIQRTVAGMMPMLTLVAPLMLA